MIKPSKLGIWMYAPANTTHKNGSLFLRHTGGNRLRGWVGGQWVEVALNVNGPSIIKRPLYVEDDEDVK